MKKTKLKLDDYYQVARESFQKIWQNKAIWFWGLFISAGASLNFGGENFENKPAQVNKMDEFFSTGNPWIWVIFLTGFVLAIIFWIISGIARSGVIKEFNTKQNTKKHKLGFKKIWTVGRKDFKKILVFDLVIFGLVLAVLVLDFLIIVPAIIINNIGLLIFIGVLLAIFSVLLFLFLAILRPFALVQLVLSNSTIKNSLLGSWNLLKVNWKEFFKLILTLIIIGFINGMLLVLLAGFLGIGWSLLYGAHGVPGGGQSMALMMIVSFLLGAILLFLVLTAKAFFGLWKIDILIWWVKKMKGQKISKKEQKDIAKKVTKRKKVPVGAKA